jgi:hypothetical protein
MVVKLILVTVEIIIGAIRFVNFIPRLHKSQLVDISKGFANNVAGAFI